jgi:hypothetical protein
MRPEDYLRLEEELYPKFKNGEMTIEDVRNAYLAAGVDKDEVIYLTTAFVGDDFSEDEQK